MLRKTKGETNDEEGEDIGDCTKNSFVNDASDESGSNICVESENGSRDIVSE